MRLACALLVSLSSLLVSACATGVRPAGVSDEAARKLETHVGGGLLVVRLLRRFDPPARLKIEIASIAGLPIASISGRLQQSIPGQHADYLFALALPAGHYTLSAVGYADVSASEPLAVLGARLDLSQPDPVYLGRLTLRSGRSGASGAEVGIEDDYENDTLLFRTSVPELRRATIHRAVLAADGLLPRDLPTDSAATAAAPGARDQMTVAPIDAAAAPSFSPAARVGFAQYLRLRSPRAFAASDSGAFAHAEGRDAVARALTNCTRAAKGAACRVVAVDQTLVTMPPCSAGPLVLGSTACKAVTAGPP